ncbi:helix-turn-helix domain-containing protein [Nocardia gipuzkoensis]
MAQDHEPNDPGAAAAEEDDAAFVDEMQEHAELLQAVRDQELEELERQREQRLEEYKKKLDAEYEPERQRIRKSSREALESIEKAFGEQVRQWRKARGWSQEDLASKLEVCGFDMHQTTVAKIERGTRPLRVAEAVALAQIFRVPPLSIFYGKGPEDGTFSMESMQTLIENYEQSINDAEEQLESEARHLAFLLRQRAVVVDNLNRAALLAEKRAAEKGREE